MSGPDAARETSTRDRRTSRKKRSQAETRKNGAPMNPTTMMPRQPLRHPPSKPLRLAAPNWAEHPSVMAPLGWYSRMRSLLGGRERFSSR